jgi:hypothetical protein
MTECSVHWCERHYKQNHISPSHQFLETTNTQNLYVEGRTTGSLTVSLNTLNSKTLSADSNYTLGPTNPLQNMMINSFNGTLLRDLGEDNFAGVQTALLLYNSENLTEAMANMAISMTDVIRSSQGSTHVSGRAYRVISFIHVRWPWIILPVASVM